MYSRPWTLPPGNQRNSIRISSGSAAWFIASKSIRVVVGQEGELRALEVAFPAPCRAPPRPGRIILLGMSIRIRHGLGETVDPSLEIVERVARQGASAESPRKPGSGRYPPRRQLRRPTRRS